MTMPQAHEDASAFWEGHYAKQTKPSGGRPSAILVRFTEGLVPGRALDLGCARGDDTIWLAKQGWEATGVDVAQSAIDAAQLAAEHAGVAERAGFALLDLNASIPDGAFDLVSAMFLHSPGKFDRAAALQRAASAVAQGGLLLIAAHGSRAPCPGLMRTRSIPRQKKNWPISTSTNPIGARSSSDPSNGLQMVRAAKRLR